MGCRSHRVSRACQPRTWPRQRWSWGVSVRISPRACPTGFEDVLLREYCPVEYQFRLAALHRRRGPLGWAWTGGGDVISRSASECLPRSSSSWIATSYATASLSAKSSAPSENFSYSSLAPRSLYSSCSYAQSIARLTFCGVTPRFSPTASEEVLHGRTARCRRCVDQSQCQPITLFLIVRVVDWDRRRSASVSADCSAAHVIDRDFMDRTGLRFVVERADFRTEHLDVFTAPRRSCRL